MYALWQAGIDWDDEPPPKVRSKRMNETLYRDEGTYNNITFPRSANATKSPMLLYSQTCLNMPLELAPTPARDQTMTSTRSN